MINLDEYKEFPGIASNPFQFLDLDHFWTSQNLT